MVAGGVGSGGGDVTTTQIYDPGTDSWSTGPSMPTAQAFAGQGMVASGSQLFVAGGTPNNQALQIGVTCFMPGTLVRTPDGERAVETFKSGDMVVTTDGQVAPVRWVGRQTVSRVFGDPMARAADPHQNGRAG